MYDISLFAQDKSTTYGNFSIWREIISNQVSEWREEKSWAAHDVRDGYVDNRIHHIRRFQCKIAELHIQS